MQEAGEKLCLRYIQYKDRLYAVMLHHLLETIEGTLINGYTANGGVEQPSQAALFC